MKKYIFVILLVLAGFGSYATASEDRREAEASPEIDTARPNDAIPVGEARGIDQVSQEPFDDSDPDDWGQGEIILGEDKPKWRSGVVPKQIAGEKEDEERKRKKIEDLEKALRQKGMYRDGWHVEFDNSGEPYIEGPNGERLDDQGNIVPEPSPADPSDQSDPDDWGQGEKVL